MENKEPSRIAETLFEDQAQGRQICSTGQTDL